MLSSPLDAVAASARPFVWKDIEETATHTTDLKAQPEQGDTVTLLYLCKKFDWNVRIENGRGWKVDDDQGRACLRLKKTSIDRPGVRFRVAMAAKKYDCVL